MLGLGILREVPRSRPRRFEAGSEIHHLWEFVPHRREIAEGILTIDDSGRVVLGPKANRGRCSGWKSEEQKTLPATVTSGDLEREEVNMETDQVEPVSRETAPTSARSSGGSARRSRTEEDDVVVMDMVTQEDKRRKALWSKMHLNVAEDIELQRLLLKHRDRLEGMRRLNREQEEDLARIRSNPPEKKLTSLRERSDWERIMLLVGAHAQSASGVIGPGPRFVRMEEYRASKADILAGRMRIRNSTGQVVPTEVGKGRQARAASMTQEEIDERKTWCFNLSVIGQRARLEALKRLRDLGFELREEQQIDYDYLKEALRM